MRQIIIYLIFVLAGNFSLSAQSWTADNGNGTFTNPLFYDEFSDPDMIRVGEYFYMTGTSMHSMPGLAMYRSKDLVNWEFLSYVFEKLNLGPEFRLEEGKEEYGQGIWAPCLRYHNGKFYIFSNVNNHGLQIFIAEDPAGSWEHIKFGGQITYDLSVLFDDDGKIYAVYGYDTVQLIELKPDFSGIVEGSKRVIVHGGNAMSEGHHFYKINGKYFIFSANYAPIGRMQCARADHINGPYETRVISTKETFGTKRGYRVNDGIMWQEKMHAPGDKFDVWKPLEYSYAAAPLHQGGIIDLPNGEWWGFSMLDFRSVGRTTCISPITWVDGWPYFGLEGNLGRTPRTWYKPNVDVDVKPHAPFVRNDNFNGYKLNPVWQWSHEPNNKKWLLDKNKGVLRLYTMPADHFIWAKNSLTQRGIGPDSYATVTLDAAKLKPGDIAGLALMNQPYAWIGVVRDEKGYTLRWYDQLKDETIDKPLNNLKIYLRAFGNFDEDIAQLSYSLNGKDFINVGDSILMPYQLKTFQGTRYALFAYNERGKEGGYAQFDDFVLQEPLADRSQNLPLGKVIRMTNYGSGNQVWANYRGMLDSSKPGSKAYNTDACLFRVHDRGQGRVVLEALNGSGFVTVVGTGIAADVRLLKQESEGSLFMWQDMLRGQCMLLSLKTNRFIGIDARTDEPYSADWPGTMPNRKDGTVLTWEVVNPQ